MTDFDAIHNVGDILSLLYQLPKQKRELLEIISAVINLPRGSYPGSTKGIYFRWLKNDRTPVPLHRVVIEPQLVHPNTSVIRKG